MRDIKQSTENADRSVMGNLYKEQETFYTAEGMVFEQFEFNCFWAEFAQKENDIIFHFYLPSLKEEISTDSPFFRGYWLHFFPKMLVSSSSVYFKTDESRLQGVYVPDMLSYWFRAAGFVNTVLDFRGFAEGFLEYLNNDVELGMYPALRILFIDAVANKALQQKSQ